MYYVLFIIQIFSVNLLLSGFCVEDMCVDLKSFKLWSEDPHGLQGFENEVHFLIFIIYFLIFSSKCDPGLQSHCIYIVYGSKLSIFLYQKSLEY